MTAHTKEQLQEKIRRLEKIWNSEFWDAARSKEGIEAWKKEAVRENLLKIPDPPRPPNREQWQSVFLPSQFSTGLADKIHMDDYSQFYSLICNAAAYRLDKRIAQPSNYPIPRPDIPNFPAIKRLEPKEINYWLLWIAFQRKRYNDWLTDVMADRELYWKTKKDEFERACRECLGQWEEAKSQWDTAVAHDRTKLQDLRSPYETGNSKGVVDYFQAQLDSIPLPR